MVRSAASRAESLFEPQLALRSFLKFMFEIEIEIYLIYLIYISF